VTKRIGTVSRREEGFSIEELDSILFRIPELVDYRASWDGKLRLHCLSLGSVADRIPACIAQRYPGVKAEISEETASGKHRPMYPGKRYIPSEQGTAK
jgi:hypothetical protein